MNERNWIDVESPIGLIRVFESNDKIVALEIAAKKAGNSSSSKSKLLQEAAKQVQNYFSGKSTKFDLPLEMDGTAFQKAVWKKIAKVGFGKKISYAEIARAIGKPKAARAVGGAVGANPIPLIVGCHRVLGAAGKITGYSGGKGIPTKQWLLEHEGIDSKA